MHDAIKLEVSFQVHLLKRGKRKSRLGVGHAGIECWSGEQ